MTLASDVALNEDLAAHYAADLLYRALVEAGEPAKASEAVRLVGREDVDLRLTRVILATHKDRFAAAERRWTLWTRFADPGHALERNIEEAVQKYGLPIRISALAREMSAVYGRSTEYFEGVLPRVMQNRERYFPAGDETYGLNKWLLDTQGETEEDILFDNYLSTPDVAKYEHEAAGLDPKNTDTVLAFLDAVNAPVPNKALQFLAWRVNPRRFAPAAFFSALWRDGRAVLLSGGQWIGPKATATLTGFFPALSEQEVEELLEQAVEPAQPLVIPDEEREQLINTVLQSETTSRAARLLESVFEVSPGDTTYEGDLQTILDALRGDERILWVGADRFVPQGTVPEYVFSVPESLHIPVTRYTDVEGNEMDVLLEDDGFDGSLQREVFSPLAQDVLDEEPAMSPEDHPASTARCVLKLHHKEIGTFPLCQLPPGFFPITSPLVQADVVLPSGQKVEVWVNNETRLLYGLLDWYLGLPVDSGAVFYLERQAPDRYVLTYGEETEAAMFISRNRVNDLMEMGRRAEEEELPTFDILREIMEHYRKGIEYITLLTEVNIARRATRRSVASLLSGYHCFFQRGGAWVYDAKKLTQGFDKSKRKYLIR